MTQPPLVTTKIPVRSLFSSFPSVDSRDTLHGDGPCPAARRSAGAASSLDGLRLPSHSSDSLLQSRRGPMTSSSGRADEHPPIARTRLRWRGPDVLLRGGGRTSSASTQAPGHDGASPGGRALGRASALPCCGASPGEPPSLRRRISRRISDVCIVRLNCFENIY